MSRRDELVDRMVRLKAHQDGIARLRDQLLGRAQQQRDAVDGDVHTVGAFESAGQGGIMVHRMHRTLLSDRDRLERLRRG